MSQDRSRMIWAERPTISPPNDLYIFDALGGPVDATPIARPVSVNDSVTNFTRYNLAISGDGSRFMYREQVYGSDLQYVGSVAPRNVFFAPALSWRGTRAAVYDIQTDEVTLYDLSSDTFASLGVIETFSSDVLALQLMFHPADTVLFVWGGRAGPGSNYTLFVRELP